MKNQLFVELIQYSQLKNHHPLSQQQPLPLPRPKKIPPESLSKAKSMILGILISSFLLYKLFHEPKQLECVSDLLHQWTSAVNRLLNENNLFYQVMLIIAQQSIELNIFLLCILSTFKINNLKAHFFMALFYGTRGILLNIQRFPYPPHIIWDAPIIPSLTVPYGITRDYFYSGHTGLMLFCTFWWKHLGYNALYLPSLALTPVVILVLLSTRVHYSIDILAAIVFTFWIQAHLLKHVIYLDKFFSLMFGLLGKAFDCFKKIIN